MKVVRDVITKNLDDSGSDCERICPPRRSTGFYPGGDGCIPAPRKGLLPGTFIGPTLVFPGVLNPGIPTTVPPTNPTVNNFGTQVQIAQAQDGGHGDSKAY